MPLNPLLFKLFRYGLISILFFLIGNDSAYGQPFCPQNIDFSFGNFNNWSCYTGTSQSSSPTGTYPIFANPFLSGPIAGPPNRHGLTTGAGTDYFGGFPIVAPGGGLYSMMIGNNQSSSAAERTRYMIHVPGGVNDYGLQYKIAMVMKDSVHAPSEQPAFTVIAYDSASGNPLPCATMVYAKNNGGSPAFLRSTVDPNVYYLPWTNGNLDLSGTAGKTIILEVTSYDCTDGGHFAYGYFDIISCNSQKVTVSYCNLDAKIITIAAPSGYANYTWYKGPPATGILVGNGASNNLNIAVPPTPAIYYCIRTPFGGNGCKDTIQSRAISDFVIHAFPDTVCANFDPLIIGVTASGGIGGFYGNILADPRLYNPSVGSYDTLLKVHLAPGSGNQQFLFYVTDSNKCVRIDTVMERKASYTVNIGPDHTTCLGVPITLNAAISPYLPSFSLNWQNQVAGSLSSTSSPQTIYTSQQTGIDTVILRVDSASCTIGDTVLIRTLPNSFSASDTSLCSGQVFHPNVAGDTNFAFAWSPITGISIGQTNLQSPEITADTTRTYKITASYPGCPDIIRNIVINVEPQPELRIIPDTIYKCPETAITISPSITPMWFNNYHYEWDFHKDISNLHASEIIFKGNKDTTLFLTASTPIGCSNKDSVRIMVYEAAIVELPDSLVIDPGTSYQLDPISNGVFYVWSPVTGLENPNYKNPVASPPGDIQYIVTASSADGCTASDSIRLLFRYEDTPIDIPNAFNPGGMINKEFKIIHLGKATLKRFQIFNRWGNKVFETTDIDKGWDGTYNGTAQPAGVYVYIVETISFKGKIFYRQGNVTLFR